MHMIVRFYKKVSDKLESPGQITGRLTRLRVQSIIGRKYLTTLWEEGFWQ